MQDLSNAATIKHVPLGARVLLPGVRREAPEVRGKVNEEEKYSITPAGWAIAEDVYRRYSKGTETVEEIAVSYGVDVPTITSLMTRVFSTVGDM